MAKEILAIPEDDLAVFVQFLRESLHRDGRRPSGPLPPHIHAALARWCDEEQDYLDCLAAGEEGEE
ncbi:MAG: hypothetical protein ACE5IJ_11315 [Thermoplasmata archaeon]